MTTAGIHRSQELLAGPILCATGPEAHLQSASSLKPGPLSCEAAHKNRSNRPQHSKDGSLVSSRVRQPAAAPTHQQPADDMAAALSDPAAQDTVTANQPLPAPAQWQQDAQVQQLPEPPLKLLTTGLHTADIVHCMAGDPAHVHLLNADSCMEYLLLSCKAALMVFWMQQAASQARHQVCPSSESTLCRLLGHGGGSAA